MLVIVRVHFENDVTQLPGHGASIVKGAPVVSSYEVKSKQDRRLPQEKACGRRYHQASRAGHAPSLVVRHVHQKYAINSALCLVT